MILKSLITRLSAGTKRAAPRGGEGQRRAALPRIGGGIPVCIVFCTWEHHILKMMHSVRASSCVASVRALKSDAINVVVPLLKSPSNDSRSWSYMWCGLPVICFGFLLLFAHFHIPPRLCGCCIFGMLGMVFYAKLADFSWISRTHSVDAFPEINLT